MSTTDDRRRRSYRVGGRISRERIARDAPDDHEALEAVERSDIVVVTDVYDHVEWVLEALDLPYTTVGTAAAGRLRLRPDQLLVINCPGHIGRTGVANVRRFVDVNGNRVANAEQLIAALRIADQVLGPGVQERLLIHFLVSRTHCAFLTCCVGRKSPAIHTLQLIRW